MFPLQKYKTFFDYIKEKANLLAFSLFNRTFVLPLQMKM